MATATQSVTPNALLAAVKHILTYGDGTAAATGVNEAYINESYTDFRPRSGEPYELTYALLPETPEMYSGAGRKGHNTYLTLEVTIFVRMELDPAGSDFIWSSSTDYGGLVMRTRVNDILQDNFLYSAYNAVTFVPTGTPLTIEGLQQLPSPRPQKPDKQTTAVADGGDAGGYGEFTLRYQLKTVQPLTI